jgi:hypothetical protein
MTAGRDPQPRRGRVGPAVRRVRTAAAGPAEQPGQRGGDHRQQLVLRDPPVVAHPVQDHLLGHRGPATHHQPHGRGVRGGEDPEQPLAAGLLEDPVGQCGPRLLVDRLQLDAAARGAADQRGVPGVVVADVVDVGPQRHLEPLEGPAPGDRRRHLDEVVGSPAADRPLEVLLAAEVVVEQATGDAGLLGEHLDRQLVDGAGGQHPHPEAEQLLATGARRHPDPALTPALHATASY